MKSKNRFEEIEKEINQIDSMQVLLTAGVVALFGKAYEINFLFYIASVILIYSFYLMIFYKEKKKSK